jgi:hypothetical protein
MPYYANAGRGAADKVAQLWCGQRPPLRRALIANTIKHSSHPAEARASNFSTCSGRFESTVGKGSALPDGAPKERLMSKLFLVLAD